MASNSEKIQAIIDRYLANDKLGNDPGISAFLRAMQVDIKDPYIKRTQLSDYRREIKRLTAEFYQKELTEKAQAQFEVESREIDSPERRAKAQEIFDKELENTLVEKRRPFRRLRRAFSKEFRLRKRVHTIIKNSMALADATQAERLACATEISLALDNYLKETYYPTPQSMQSLNEIANFQKMAQETPTTLPEESTAAAMPGIKDFTRDLGLEGYKTHKQDPKSVVKNVLEFTGEAQNTNQYAPIANLIIRESQLQNGLLTTHMINTLKEQFDFDKKDLTVSMIDKGTIRKRLWTKDNNTISEETNYSLQAIRCTLPGSDPSYLINDDPEEQTLRFIDHGEFEALLQSGKINDLPPIFNLRMRTSYSDPNAEKLSNADPSELPEKTPLNCSIDGPIMEVYNKALHDLKLAIEPAEEMTQDSTPGPSPSPSPH